MTEVLPTDVLSCISQDSVLTYNSRSINANYHEGYEQIAQPDINSMFKVWSLNFEIMTDSEMKILKDFYILHGVFKIWKWEDGVDDGYSYFRFSSSLSLSNNADTYNIVLECTQAFGGHEDAS